MTVYLTPSDIATLAGFTARRTSYNVKCPAHNDRLASLHISKGEKATIMFCHAGCSLQEVCDSFGIQSQQLYYDYDPTGPNPRSPASLKLKEMIKRRTAPDRWELQPHQSFEDVVYEVMDVSPEVWATVKVRWQDELERPFMDVWAQWYTVEAILTDLLEEHLDKGWDYTIALRHELRWKLMKEWDEHKTQTK